MYFNTLTPEYFQGHPLDRKTANFDEHMTSILLQ